MRDVLRLCACALVLFATSFRSTDGQFLFCPAIPLLPGGTISGVATTGLENGVQVARVSCNPGYFASGTNPPSQFGSYTCNNGQWPVNLDCLLIGTQPRCTPITLIPNGQVIYEPVLQTLSVTCNLGFTEPTTGRSIYTANCVNSRFVVSGLVGGSSPSCISRTGGDLGQFCPYIFSFVSIRQNLNTCAGTQCVGGTVCCTQPRIQTSSCTRLETRLPPKPGQCPFTQIVSQTCSNQCNDDRACPGNQKCCRRPSGINCGQQMLRVCANPQINGCQRNPALCTFQERCTDVIDRAPICINQQCSTNTASNCLQGNFDLCTQDSQCQGGQACCWDGCRRTCLSIGGGGVTCAGVTCVVPQVCQIIGGRPVCVIRPTCPFINIPNGQVSSRGISIDTQVGITCNPGFVRTGAATTWCTPVSAVSSQWIPTLPTCDAIVGTNCPPLNILNGFPSSRLTQNGAVVNIICNPGFTPSPVSQITCIQGQWSRIPQCIATAQCPVLRIPNAQLSTLVTSLGTSVTITCNNGFQLQNQANFRIVCQNIFNTIPAWSANPICTSISCPSLIAPRNGILTSGNPLDNRVSTVKTFSCNLGFRGIGSARRMCQQNGFWSGQAFSCTLATCTIPIARQNGIVTPQGDGRVGSVVIYSCIPGFQVPQGQGQGICGNNGIYSPGPPTCTSIVCRPVTPPFNGGKIPAGNTVVQVNGRVQFFCNNGFTLQGSSQLFCQSNGAYNGNPPTCTVGRCLAPPIVTFGQPQLSNGVNIGSRAQYICNSGFSLVSTSQLVCTDQINGQPRWVGLVPQCVGVRCPAVQPPVNGVLSPASSLPGSTIQVTCNPGFQIVGQNILTCSSVSTNVFRYMPNVPQCLPIRCNILSAPQFGRIDFPNVPSPGSIATYSCNSGYRLDGPTRVICGTNGMWTRTQLVRCTRISCSNQLPRIANVVNTPPVGFGDTSFGKTYLLQCVNGFMPESITIFCSQNAQWETVQSCLIRPKCPNIQVGGNVQMAMQPDQVTIQFSCNAGFVLEGLTRRTCQNGIWTPAANIQTEPTCRRVGCDVPSVPPTGPLSVSTSGAGGLGTVYTFQCRPGFSLSGASSITCLTGNVLSGPIPRCIVAQNQCANRFGNPTFGFVTYSQISARSRRADFGCNQGYRLEGPTFSSCMDGVWNPSIAPRCVLSVVTRCPDVRIANGQVRIERIVGGAQAFFTCALNFRLIGPTRVQCSDAIGRWIGTPQCVINTQRTCSGLTLANGLVLYSTGGFTGADGTVARLSCSAGYTLNGPREVTCSNSEWRPEFTSQCVRDTSQGTSCSPVPFENGDAMYSNLGNTGSIASFTCNTGFTLLGQITQSTCSNNGQWQPTPPNSCFRDTNPTQFPPTGIRCPILTLIGGNIGYSNQGNEGSVARFTCEAPLTLTGSSESTCRRGAWQPAVDAQCTNSLPSQSCAPISFSEQAGETVNYSNLGNHGSIATFICNNQRLQSSTCQNGQWIPAPPSSCPTGQRQCPQNLQVTNGIVTYTSTVFASVTCRAGFSIQGPSQVTCNQGTGQWNLITICSSVGGGQGCGDYPRVVRGTLRYNSAIRAIGTRVELTCTVGAPRYATCQANGWIAEGQPLICPLGRIVT